MKSSRKRGMTRYFTLYPQQLTGLDELTELRGDTPSAALRECIPSINVLKVYRRLAAANTRLSYSDFIEQVVREWLITGAPALTVSDMIQGLRSGNLEERIRAGKLLSFSIGAGLRVSGESEADVLHTVGVDLSRLLGQAMAGDDPSAVDYLEQILTTTPTTPKTKPAHVKAKGTVTR